MEAVGQPAQVQKAKKKMEALWEDGWNRTQKMVVIFGWFVALGFSSAVSVISCYFPFTVDEVDDIPIYCRLDL